MNFLYRIRCALARFMYGRNGVDQLSWALLIFELALSLFVPMLGIDALSIAAQLLSYVCSFLIFFRIFSIAFSVSLPIEMVGILGIMAISIVVLAIRLLLLLLRKQK